MHIDNFGKEIKVGDYIFGATDHSGPGTLYFVTKTYDSGVRGKSAPYGNNHIYTSGILQNTKGFIVIDPSTVPDNLRYLLED